MCLRERSLLALCRLCLLGVGGTADGESYYLQLRAPSSWTHGLFSWEHVTIAHCVYHDSNVTCVITNSLDETVILFN